MKILRTIVLSRPCFKRAVFYVYLNVMLEILVGVLKVSQTAKRFRWGNHNTSFRFCLPGDLYFLFCFVDLDVYQF